MNKVFLLPEYVANSFVRNWEKIIDSNDVLEFLKIYQNLDELCRKILSSDIGISEYINEMSNESQGIDRIEVLLFNPKDD